MTQADGFQSITRHGQVAQFSCKQTVSLSLWDAKANRAKGKGAEAQKINHALDKIKEAKQAVKPRIKPANPQNNKGIKM